MLPYVRTRSNVHAVHRLALAADRAQLTAVRAAAVDFCSRPGVEPVSLCEVPYNATLQALRATINDLEVYHHAVYLGQNDKPKRLAQPTMYDMWTDPGQPYQVGPSCRWRAMES